MQETDLYKGNINCPCCGAQPQGSALWFLNSLAREFKGVFGRALQVTSGMRCDNHNKAVGGTDGSAHTKGLAFDIAFGNSQELYLILRHLYALQVERIGLNFDKSFVHFDLDETRPHPVFFKY